MTFREKFHEEFPKAKRLNPALIWCPSAFDYEADWTCDPENLNSEEPDCNKCWDREIPGQERGPKFIIEIEPIMRSSDLVKREIAMKLGEDQNEELIEVRSKGLSQEERTILMEAMERTLRRIRNQRRRNDRPDVRYQAELD